MNADERRAQYLTETGRREVERPAVGRLLKPRAKPCRTTFPPRLKALIVEIAEKYAVTSAELLSPTKTATVAAARRELIREMDSRFEYSGSRIAMLLGLHHTTVFYHLKGKPVPAPFDPAKPDESGVWAI